MGGSQYIIEFCYNTNPGKLDKHQTVHILLDSVDVQFRGHIKISFLCVGSFLTKSEMKLCSRVSVHGVRVCWIDPSQWTTTITTKVVICVILSMGWCI